MTCHWGVFVIHPSIREPIPGYPGPTSPPEGISVGLRKSSKYSLHQSTTSLIEVSSTPSPLYIMLTVHCFPLLIRQIVVQNLFDLTELLPLLGFYLSDCHSRTPLGLPVTVWCLGGLIGLLPTNPSWEGCYQSPCAASRWYQLYLDGISQLHTSAPAP